MEDERKKYLDELKKYKSAEDYAEKTDEKIKYEKGKHGEYIVYRTPHSLQHPYDAEDSISMLHMGHHLVKGSFYFGGVWIRKARSEEAMHKPHWHEWDEYLVYYGSNPDDPYDLCGEVELWVGDEKHTLTRSCLVYVPMGLVHLPCFFRRVDRPILWITTGPTLIHTKHLVDNPKWSHLKPNPPSMYTYPPPSAKFEFYREK